MAALEVVTGFSTAPTAVFGAVAVAFSNGTATIRNFSTGNAWLLTAWNTQNTTAGGLRIRSPRLHDFVNGIRFQVQASNNQPLYPFGFPQQLKAQDLLTIELAGSAVAGDIVNFALLIYYESLDSANGRFIDLTELENRMVNATTQIHALVGAVTGAYGAAQALNAGVVGATLKANTDYALLGAVMSESAAGNGCNIGIVGVDTGNLMVGIPVQGADPDLTNSWFLNLTKRMARPLVPVINSANAGATLLSVLNSENANTVTVATIWAELR